MPFLYYLKKFDWWLIASSILLSILGLVGIASVAVARGDFSDFFKQLGFLIVGLILMIWFSFFDYRVLKNNSYLILGIYGFCLTLLIGLYFFAPVTKGVQSWYKIGLFSFGPNEVMKLVFIILLAKYFSMRHTEMYKFHHIVFSGLYGLIPALLIFFQPDLGGALVIFLIWLSVLFVSGIKLNHFLIIVFCLMLASLFAWSVMLQDYQKSRIVTFLFPYDHLGAAWTQNQTRISIGSGQIFGQGFAKGSQVQYGFLPEPHTDFIFSVLAHEWGIAGVIAIFLLYGILIWRIIVIGVIAPSNFPRFFALGFAILIIIQFFINIGMNIVVIPVIGIALPFISYGGSGLISLFIGLGILQGIQIRRYD